MALRKIAPEERKQLRQVYASKIMNAVRVKGFLSLTIQDLADLMQISRASLYNYFTSKEDIIMEMTKLFIQYTHEAERIIANEEMSYAYRLLKVYEQSVLSAIYASDNYLHDLKASCVLLYEEKLEYKRERRAVVKHFYLKGMETGVFQELNADILMMQEEACLDKLFHSSFLVEADLSLKQALYDCYRAKEAQILRPEAERVGREQLEEIVHNIVKRLTSNV